MYFPVGKNVSAGNVSVAMGKKVMYARFDNKDVFKCNPSQDMIEQYLNLATSITNKDSLNDLALAIKRLDYSRRIGLK